MCDDAHHTICLYACYDTTAFARRIEKAVFPNDLHFKVALTGCPSDCAKVRPHDFGIIGMTLPEIAEVGHTIYWSGLKY